MRYVSSVERFGIEKGVLQGRIEGRLQGRQEGELRILKKLLERRFGTLTTSYKNN
jgi:predicted transposase YdaD